MSPSARKILVALSTGLLVGILTACSKQGEGERCDTSKAGDSDCEDGLVCTNLNRNVGEPPLERCCPPGNAPISDDRCNPTSAPPSSSGGASSGGVSGAGAGGNSTGGTSGGAIGEAGSGASGATDAGSTGASGAGGSDAFGTDASSGAGGA